MTGTFQIASLGGVGLASDVFVTHMMGNYTKSGEFVSKSVGPHESVFRGSRSYGYVSFAG